MDSSRRTGLLLAAAGAAPFCVAPLTAEGPELRCPVRAATGLPCPLCGATRAFRATTDGGAWWTFNGAWVVLALAAIAGGLLLAAGARLPRPAPGRATWVAAVLVLGVVPWGYALAQRGVIVT